MDHDQRTAIHLKIADRIEAVLHDRSYREDWILFGSHLNELIKGSIENDHFGSSLCGQSRRASTAERCSEDRHVIWCQAVSIAEKIHRRNAVLLESLFARCVVIFKASILGCHHIGVEIVSQSPHTLLEIDRAVCIAVKDEYGFFLLMSHRAVLCVVERIG